MGKGIYIGISEEKSQKAQYPLNETTLPIGSGKAAEYAPNWNPSTGLYEFPDTVIAKTYSSPYQCVNDVDPGIEMYYIPDSDKSVYYRFQTAK